MMKKWLQRIIVGLACAFILVYAGDWAVFKLRGSPHATVTVSRYMDVPLKGNKQEFDALGSVDVPCSLSLFPQAGQPPCWQVRRNTTQAVKI